MPTAVLRYLPGNGPQFTCARDVTLEPCSPQDAIPTYKGLQTPALAAFCFCGTVQGILITLLGLHAVWPCHPDARPRICSIKATRPFACLPEDWLRTLD